MKIILVGSGFTSYCVYNELLKYFPQAQYTCYSIETECNDRPSLFFPLAIIKSQKYSPPILDSPEKLEIIQAKVIAIGKLTIQLEQSDKIIEVPYDVCCICTGSKPRFSLESVIKQDKDGVEGMDKDGEEGMDKDGEEGMDDVSTGNDLERSTQQVIDSPLIYQMKKMEQSPSNVIILRNHQEIEQLQTLQRQKGAKPIVFIGGGVLCVDAVSHLLTGLKSIHEDSGSDEKTNPRVIIISRSSNLANGFFKNDKIATNFITKATKRFPFLELITNDEMTTMVCNDMSVEKIITKNGRSIECSAVCMCMGVISNVEIALKSNFDVISEGIKVNKYYQVESNDIRPATVFSCGDVAAVPRFSYVHNNYVHQSWKNWTAAREEAIECARMIALFHGEKNEEKESSMIFHQNLRMFEYYVSCIGEYDVSYPIPGDILIIKKSTCDDDYVKFVFKRIRNDVYILIGAIVIGLSSEYHNVACSLIELIKMHVMLGEGVISSIMNLDNLMWDIDWKCLVSDGVKNKFVLESKKRVKKKYKNPLLKNRKRKTKQTTQEEV